MPKQRSAKTTDHRERCVKGYAPCSKCGKARHKTSKSVLCQTCYWEWRRAESPFTGLTQSQYDALRYRADVAREQRLQKQYGLTLADYDALLLKQGGKCAICHEKPDTRPKSFTHGGFVVDHDHDTGVVRGLLCDRCNKGIGQFRESALLIRRALEYLNETGSLDYSLDDLDRSILCDRAARHSLA